MPSAKPHHLTLSGRPYCDMLGCMAGMNTADKLGVRSCDYPSRNAALKAASRLRSHYACVAVVPGRCAA